MYFMVSVVLISRVPLVPFEFFFHLPKVSRCVLGQSLASARFLYSTNLKQTGTTWQLSYTLEGKQWLSLISDKSSAACQVQRPYNPLYWKITRTLASSQSPSDTTLKQWTNVNIVHILSITSILRENCFPKHFKSTYKLDLVTMIGGVYLTQTIRDGIAQVTKRQVFSRLSQLPLYHCLCWFHNLFLFFKEGKE